MIWYFIVLHQLLASQYLEGRDLTIPSICGIVALEDPKYSRIFGLRWEPKYGGPDSSSCDTRTTENDRERQTLSLL